jgi:hypothetical protein
VIRDTQLRRVDPKPHELRVTPVERETRLQPAPSTPTSVRVTLTDTNMYQGDTTP